MFYYWCHFILKDETGPFKQFKSHMRDVKYPRDQGFILKGWKTRTKTLSIPASHPKTDKQGTEKGRTARKKKNVSVTATPQMKTHHSCNYISGYLLTQKTHYVLEASTLT